MAIAQEGDKRAVITGQQIEAARVLLNWSQMSVAEAAELDVQVITDFEADRRKPNPEELVQIERALEAAGVEFTNGGEPGVKLKRKVKFDENIESPYGLGDAEAG